MLIWLTNQTARTRTKCKSSKPKMESHSTTARAHTNLADAINERQKHTRQHLPTENAKRNCCEMTQETISLFVRQRFTPLRK